MGTIIKVPAVNQQYEYPGGTLGAFASDVATALQNGVSRYGSDIARASQLTGVPKSVILGFMVIENTGLNPNASNSYGATGLMQITRDSAAYVIYHQSKSPDFTMDEKRFIEQYVRNAYDSKGDVASESALKNMLTPAVLKNPSFNIYIGSMMLGLYLMESQEKYGQFRIDHAIIKYNAGIGTFANKIDKLKLSSADTTTILQRAGLSRETQSYIVKVLGINGSMDQIIKRNII